jgi:hypothetical protein
VSVVPRVCLKYLPYTLGGNEVAQVSLCLFEVSARLLSCAQFCYEVVKVS